VEQHDRGLRNSHFVVQALKIVSEAVRVKFYAAEAVAVALRAKVNAISDANGATRAELQAVDQRRFGLGHELDRYKRAGIHAPEEMQREALEMDRRALELSTRFELGRTKLESASRKLEEQLAVARRILADALEGEISCLGFKAKELVEKDIEFLLAYPSRAPRELADLQRQATQLGDIVLGLTGRNGFRAFAESAGPDVLNIMDRAASASLWSPIAV